MYPGPQQFDGRDIYKMTIIIIYWTVETLKKYKYRDRDESND